MKGTPSAAGDVARRAGQELHQAERAGGRDRGGVERALLARSAASAKRTLDRARAAEVDHREGRVEQHHAAFGAAARHGERRRRAASARRRAGPAAPVSPGAVTMRARRSRNGPRALVVTGLAEIARHGHELAAAQRLAGRRRSATGSVGSFGAARAGQLLAQRAGHRTSGRTPRRGPYQSLASLARPAAS